MTDALIWFSVMLPPTPVLPLSPGFVVASRLGKPARQVCWAPIGIASGLQKSSRAGRADGKGNILETEVDRQDLLTLPCTRQACGKLCKRRARPPIRECLFDRNELVQKAELSAYHRRSSLMLHLLRLNHSLWWSSTHQKDRFSTEHDKKAP